MKPHILRLYLNTNPHDNIEFIKFTQVFEFMDADLRQFMKQHAYKMQGTVLRNVGKMMLRGIRPFYLFIYLVQ